MSQNKKNKIPNEILPTKYPVYLYHGSTIDLDTNADYIEPRSSKIIDLEEAVFAANQYWLALFFIAKSGDCDIESGFVNGRPYILEAYPGAYDKFLSGKSGYIYYLKPDNFHSDPRLGLQNYEFISFQKEKIYKKEYIEDIYAALKKTNLSIITFKDKTDLIKIYMNR